jgi:arabinogalactan endo-1,4-beta-galactosidase
MGNFSRFIFHSPTKVMAASFLLSLLLSSCAATGNSKSSSAPATSLPSVSVTLPSTPLSSSFAYGMDCSSLAMIEELGGKFYDQRGKEADFFALLKAGGANTIRLRLWVDPTSGSGASYGGGHNDLATSLALAKRASAAGLSLCLDFHYSDFWTDTGHYLSPKFWEGASDKPTRLASYTQTALNAFKKEGLSVSFCQIGNETNNGLAGVALSSFDAPASDCVALFKAGVDAAKEVYPSVKTILHISEIQHGPTMANFFKSLKAEGVAYDVCGVSYYPYWHGGISNLGDVLNACASLSGKPVMVMETAWGFTDETNENVHNQFSSSGYGKVGGYATSAQGQADELSSIAAVLAKIPNQAGAGLFYWEPGWLPLKKSYWATKEGAAYLDGKTGLSEAELAQAYPESTLLGSWSNQALFDYQGKALPSLYTYAHLQGQ